MKRRYAEVNPELQRTIASEYEAGGDDSSKRALAKKHHVSSGTVQGIVERARKHGDPVTPRGHRERKLDSKEEAKLMRAAKRKPLATNRELARSVDDAIAERTVSD